MKQGAHLTKQGWSKPHTHSNPTNLALFGHKITLYRFNQGAHTIAGGSNRSRGGGAEPPWTPSLQSLIIQTLGQLERHGEAKPSRAGVLGVMGLSVLRPDQVLGLRLGLAGRQPCRRGLPHGAGHVVGTAPDHVADVLRSNVYRYDPQDAAGGRRGGRRRTVDERTGGTKTYIQLTQLLRMLYIIIIINIIIIIISI